TDELGEGRRGGLLGREALDELALWRETREQVERRIGVVREPVLVAQVIVALINRLVTDLVEASAARLEAAGIGSVDAARRAPERLVAFTPAVGEPPPGPKGHPGRRVFQHPRRPHPTPRGERLPRYPLQAPRPAPAL